MRNNTVADRYDSPFVAGLGDVKLRDTLFNQLGNFSGIELHALIPNQDCNASAKRLSLLRTLASMMSSPALITRPAIKDGSS